MEDKSFKITISLTELGGILKKNNSEIIQKYTSHYDKLLLSKYQEIEQLKERIKELEWNQELSEYV